MDDQVRIAANRRCEMGVAGSRQAEMSERLRRVASLLHGAQQYCVDQPFFRAAGGRLERLLEIPWSRRFRVRVQTDAEGAEKAGQLRDVVGVGWLVDPMQQGHSVPDQMAGNR